MSTPPRHNASRTPREIAHPPRIGIIDIGTNSVKLLIATGTSALECRRATTRLGEGAGRSPAAKLRLTDAAVQRTTSVVDAMVKRARRRGATFVFAFATAALRNATNALAVTGRIEKATGVGVRILSGKEEARLAALSAVTTLAPGSRTRDTVVVDLGGGSVEIVIVQGGRVRAGRSMPLGALFLTERFLATDPASTDEQSRLTAAVARSVSPWLRRQRLRLAGPRNLDIVVSGGTATTASRVLGSLPGRNPSADPAVLRRHELNALEQRCMALSVAQRQRLRGMPADRAEILPAGIAVLLCIMDACGKRTARINDGGVRMGALIHLMQNNLEW